MSSARSASLRRLARERPVAEADEQRDPGADERADHTADGEAAVQPERHTATSVATTTAIGPAARGSACR